MIALRDYLRAREEKLIEGAIQSCPRPDCPALCPWKPQVLPPLVRSLSALIILAHEFEVNLPGFAGQILGDFVRAESGRHRAIGIPQDCSEKCFSCAVNELRDALSGADPAFYRAEIALQVFEQIGKEIQHDSESWVNQWKTEKLEELVEQKQNILNETERALRATGRQLRALLELVPDLVWIKDAQGRYITANAALSEACGLRPDEIVGKSDLEIFPNDLALYYREHDQLVMESGQTETIEERFVDHRATEKWIETIKVPIRDDEGQITGSAGIGRDITERKRNAKLQQTHQAQLEQRVAKEVTDRLEAQRELHELELRLQRAHRMDALEVLAGGVAHDFNNILMTILGNSELLLDDVPERSPAHKSVDAIRLASLRAAELTRQMLTFTGHTRAVASAASLSRIISDNMSLIRSTCSKKVPILTSLTEDLPCANADIEQILQVILSLALNASEASEQAGSEIRIATGVEILSAAQLHSMESSAGTHPGQYVYFEVRDTGSGMDLATQQRMFEPFFSTKFTGRGLGLAATRGIVRAHRGAILVDSTIAKGTLVRIYLPVNVAEENKTSEPVRRQPSAVRIKPLVLLVDDEVEVCDVAARILDRAGFRTIQCHDGQCGVESFSRLHHELSLVLLDLGLPKLSGHEAAAQMHAIAPDVRIIITSGYDEMEARKNFETLSSCGYLQKPYDRATLLAAVRRTLVC